MIVFLPAFLSLYMLDTFGHNTVCVLSLSFGANRHFNVRVFTFSCHNSVIVFNDYYIFICICCTTHCGSSIDGWFTLIVIVV